MKIQMYFLVLLIFVFKAEPRTEIVLSCPGVMFEGRYHNKELVLTGLEQPSNMLYFKPTSELYFSQTIRYRNEVDFGIYVCHLETAHYKKIEGIPGGFAIGFDRKREKIYFGGHSGIYVFDPYTRTKKFAGEENKSIWGLFIHGDRFYYIQHPSQKLYVYKNGSFVRDNLINMEITNIIMTDTEVFFSNESALFMSNINSGSSIILHNNVETRQINTNPKGDVYVGGSDGVYVRDKDSYYVEKTVKGKLSFMYQIKKVIEVDQVFGVAFDSEGRLLYSDRNRIYRLTLGLNSVGCGGLFSQSRPTPNGMPEVSGN